MINITHNKNCCGCAACAQICPKQCILMCEDEEGFLYPKVNKSTCIGCGLCNKVCPFTLKQREASMTIKVFACKNKNSEIRKASSSGGVFSLLAEKIISQGGVVFGAIFDENWEVKHSYAETIEQLAAMRTSKYVQSRVEDSFIRAKQFISKGRYVMFVGTSCQIVALQNYLRRDYDKLLTVDIICHGTPSPKVWRKYLETIKARTSFVGKRYVPLYQKSIPEITGINFRDKIVGWKKSSFTVTLVETTAEGDKKTVLLSHVLSKDTYMRSFLSNNNLRPSCYNCPAKGGISNADITLADYWCIDRQYPNFDDDKGVSLTIVHTQKGLNALNMARLDTIEVSLEDGIRCNHSYRNSVVEPKTRQEFFNRFNAGEDLDQIVNDILHVSPIRRVVHILKSIVLRVFRSAEFIK